MSMVFGSVSTLLTTLTTILSSALSLLGLPFAAIGACAVVTVSGTERTEYNRAKSADKQFDKRPVGKLLRATWNHRLADALSQPASGCRSVR